MVELASCMEIHNSMDVIQTSDNYGGSSRIQIESDSYGLICGAFIQINLMWWKNNL